MQAEISKEGEDEVLFLKFDLTYPQKFLCICLSWSMVKLCCFEQSFNLDLKSLATYLISAKSALDIFRFFNCLCSEEFVMFLYFSSNCEASVASRTPQVSWK